MSRYGFGSNVHTLGGSSRRSTTTTFDDIQTQIIRDKYLTNISPLNNIFTKR